jgi:diketogulonate reductase-like aldo/keto reductase
VGEALAAAGLGRDEVFITTKLWNSEQGYDSSLEAFERSRKRRARLRRPLPDPLAGAHPGSLSRSLAAFKKIHADGGARSIGVSNFRIEDLERLAVEAPVA